MDQEAERLRLQGNDAFATKDWERAVKLYQSAVDLGAIHHEIAAKIYSNLAAALCKLSRFHEASSAAERATTLDPTWAKAWWRRGVCAELEKLFVGAVQYYSLANELDPNEKTFSEALTSMEKRLKLERRSTKGPLIVNHKSNMSKEEAQNQPCYVAWARLQESCASVLRPSMAAYCTSVFYPRFQTDFPTTSQWLIHGLSDWTIGLKSAVAHLVVNLNPQARQQYQAVQRQRLPQQQELDRVESILGGVPDGQSMAGLAAGFAHLGGLHIPIETGGDNATDVLLCPQPQALQSPMYQNLAIMGAIQLPSEDIVRIFGKEFKSSAAVMAASSTFFANLGQPNLPPQGGVAGSPQEVVDYIKLQLLVGKTWDGGLRKFVALQYRGTILYACLLRLMGMVAECFKFEKWAEEFITLADEEFKVTEQGTYDEKGSAFRPSFRIGMMVSRLHSLNSLRGDSINGPYSMSESIFLCMDIVDMASKIEIAEGQGEFANYHRNTHEVAWVRKPLAVAHSAMASHLNILAQVMSREDFHKFMIHHRMEADQEDLVDSFAIIAEQYRCAAEAELPDADSAAVFWWGVGANMARAEERSGFTLGQLRSAISEAQKAEEARDVGLFGPNLQRGATFETLSKLTADHFKNEPDSFILPQVSIVRQESHSLLKIGDEVICQDYEALEKKEMELYAAKDKKQKATLVDTSGVEREFGPSRDDDLPKLETLCIRELHKSGNEFAQGESDGAVIYCKAMMAAEKERSNT